MQQHSRNISGYVDVFENIKTHGKILDDMATSSSGRLDEMNLDVSEMPKYGMLHLTEGKIRYQEKFLYTSHCQPSVCSGKC